MGVIATPASAPTVPCCDVPQAATTLAPVACHEQGILSAPVSSSRGVAVLPRMRAVSLQQGQCKTLDWQLHDAEGNPVDLTGCALDSVVSDSSSASAAAVTYAVELRLQEHISGGRIANTISGTIVDPAEGRVRFEIPVSATRCPGVYFAEALLVQTESGAETGCTIFSNVFYLIVNRSTLSDGALNGGPPSLMEIRLHLRDSHAAESFLLDHIMFDDAEIALAISRPVQYWNEIPPDIGRYTTQTFPFRYAWLDAICANLFWMVAEQYRRNHLFYSAAGLAVDDQNKERNYEQAAARRDQAWKDFVRLKKASLNLEQCWGAVGSTYRHTSF